MKYIPLAVLLAACGTPSSSTETSACKGNRVWDETLEECVQPAQDASFDDAVIEDAGYVQKYEGKLYGVYQFPNVNNPPVPSFVSLDFATGKLEHILSKDNSVITLPPDATSINSAELSPSSTYILSSLSFGDSRKVYLFNLKDGSAQFLIPDMGVAQFAWKDDQNYFISLIEPAQEDESGDNIKTRIYYQSINDTERGDWLIEDPAKFVMPLAFGKETNEIAFLCTSDGVDPSIIYAEKEICSLNAIYRTHQSFNRNSQLRRGEFSFAHSERIYWPTRPGASTVYVPCAKGDKANYLCSFKLFDTQLPEIVAELNGTFLGSAIFAPYSSSSNYVLLNDTTIYDLDSRTSEGTFLPSNLHFDGSSVTGLLTWFAWRDD